MKTRFAHWGTTGFMLLLPLVTLHADDSAMAKPKEAPASPPPVAAPPDAAKPEAAKDQDRSEDREKAEAARVSREQLAEAQRMADAALAAQAAAAASAPAPDPAPAVPAQVTARKAVDPKHHGIISNPSLEPDYSDGTHHSMTEPF